MADPKKPSSPFAALEALRGALPEGPKTQEKLDDSAPDERTPFRGKLVIARTRKGRGGKTVTTVEGIDPKLAALDDVARDLRKALGCGTSVDDGAIVVQGDQVERVRAFFAARGAKRIVIGS